MPKADMKTKTSSLRTGVLLLTVANLFVKVLGFLYKVPLNAILGDEMANVNAATALFAVLYTATAAGVPGALSVSVSRARAEGDGEKIRVLFAATLRLLLAVGFIASFAVLLLARPISGGGAELGAYLCTVAIAPALFFTSVTGVLRGFFQGFSSLLPTAISELLEAIGKVVFGIGFALLALCVFEKERAVSGALAVFAITLGVMLGTAYLLVCYRKRKNGLLLSVGCLRNGDAFTHKSARRRVLALALPITATAALTSLSGFIDAQLMRPLLASHLGDEALAKAIYSDYSTGALTLYNLPAVLVTPIAAALIPYISGAVTEEKRLRAGRVTGSAFKLAALVSLPCALGLSAFAAPVLSFVFRSDTNMPENTGKLLSLLAFCVFFSALLAVSCAALQANKRERVPILSLSIGVGVKLVLMRSLVPQVGAMGVPLSTLGFFVTAALLNVYFLCRKTGLRLRLFDGFLRPLFCALSAVTLSRMAYTGILPHVGADTALLLALTMTALLYLSFLLLLRAVGREEIALLPFGCKLLRLSHSKK